MFLQIKDGFLDFLNNIVIQDFNIKLNECSRVGDDIINGKKYNSNKLVFIEIAYPDFEKINTFFDISESFENVHLADLNEYDRLKIMNEFNSKSDKYAIFIKKQKIF